MPTQWGLQDRITVNDLGKGKFLFNFTTEEDLMFVLQKGPFHYNYFMFEIKYDMLFKHCTTCGLMSHEKSYCPTLDATTRAQPGERGGNRLQAEQGGVFTRVQLPQEHNGHQPSLRYREVNSGRQLSQQDVRKNEVALRGFDTRHRNDHGGRYHDENVYQNHSRGANSHSYRIIRRRDEKPRGNRYGADRYNRGPYDRKVELSWREKRMDQARVSEQSSAHVHGGSSKSHDVVPYEHT
ncbi:unnamed protein product [Brassica napus]|uniref:(rape) hypothetical protein n=1 Tax=Brassica napus TaxID=3708 RepID=A0A816Q7H6_BRANA|nr:unnamed protein product [Brassica napus]